MVVKEALFCHMIQTDRLIALVTERSSDIIRRLTSLFQISVFAPSLLLSLTTNICM
jgi:hypothetical protein